MGSTGVFPVGLVGAGVIVTGAGFCSDSPPLSEFCPQDWVEQHRPSEITKAAIVARRITCQTRLVEFTSGCIAQSTSP